MTDTTTTKTISRRNVLKGSAAAAAGAALGSGIITGFPTIWAQNPITLRQFGTGVSNLNAIAEKCKKTSASRSK
jgi:putative spermidine/putrescine transport system substrate-binding protein